MARSPIVHLSEMRVASVEGGLVLQYKVDGFSSMAPRSPPALLSFLLDRTGAATFDELYSGCEGILEGIEMLRPSRLDADVLAASHQAFAEREQRRRTQDRLQATRDALLLRGLDPDGFESSFGISGILMEEYGKALDVVARLEARMDIDGDAVRAAFRGAGATVSEYVSQIYDQQAATSAIEGRAGAMVMIARLRRLEGTLKRALGPAGGSQLR